MESFLYYKRPTVRQMYLDPRTKILLSLTVTFITLANSGQGIMDYVKVCAAAVPLLFLFILKKYVLVVYYIGMYVLAIILPYWLIPHLPPVVNLLFTGMIAVSTQAIPQGATVAVLGNNGAGKTSFARMLCGLVKKAECTLLYKGKEYSPQKRMELCYMVMQDVNHQLFTESVEDEVRLGVDMKSEQEKRKLVEDILVELDLTDYKEAHPMSLSGGQRQRVAIAGALATQRDIIIYDEPTSGLDYRHMKDVARNIRKLSELGKTQFVITHDAELVAECCNYFIFMENGKVLCSGEWTVDNIEYVRAYFKI